MKANINTIDHHRLAVKNKRGKGHRDRNQERGFASRSDKRRVEENLP